MSAAAAIFHVRKYSASTTDTKARKTNRATMALFVTLSPQEGPMNEVSALVAGTSNSLARAFLTASVVAGVPSPSFSACTRTVPSPSFETRRFDSVFVTDVTASAARVS